jgi:hypothetical protein
MWYCYTRITENGNFERKDFNRNGTQRTKKKIKAKRNANRVAGNAKQIIFTSYLGQLIKQY